MRDGTKYEGEFKNGEITVSICVVLNFKTNNAGSWSKNLGKWKNVQRKLC
jgi:hypothetical protein